MKNISFDYSNALSLTKSELLKLDKKLFKLDKSARDKTGAGADFLGWLDLPDKISKTEIDDIVKTAEKIRSQCDAFVSIGIGGSYLGAKAVIEAMTGVFNLLTLKPQIFFAGNNISGRYLTDLLNILELKKNIFVNVISKSGTTTEPAIAFRIIKNLLVRKYKNNANSRIIATTDANKGALRKMANAAGWKSYTIPDDVGGRFSVLSPVGLLPIAVAGIDIKSLIKGARDMKRTLDSEKSAVSNIAMQYAAARFLLYSRQKKNIEILVNYSPELHFIAEWWKQLYGESEGKDGKALFPAACDFTTDLHSMGQWIQDGVRNIFETVLVIDKTDANLTIPKESDDSDELNYIAGKRLDFVNSKAMQGVIEAHLSGKVPNLKITLPQLNEYYLGQLIYFFERACAISGYLLDVNPFDQPGVEAYKKNMFRLLGKK